MTFRPIDILLLLIPLTTFSASGQYNYKDTTEFPYLNTDMNAIQFFSAEAIAPLYKAWLTSDTAKFSIVHTGDSHVQNDIYPGKVRERLSEIHGEGGRGMVFAYSTAKSYSSIHYETEHEGEWTWGKTMSIPPKIPIGVMGMSSHTEDSTAEFTIRFRNELPAEYILLKIFCKQSDRSFDITIENGDTSYTVAIDTNLSDLPYIPVEIAAPSEEFRVMINKTAPYQEFFEFYGMSIERPENTGLIYHSVGVGASRFRGILYSELFVDHLKVLEPDMVILDFGTNDYLYNDKIAPELEDQIVEIIRKVRESAPKTAILLTSTQDLYYRRRNIQSGTDFTKLIRRLAEEHDCLFYDWFWIAGGRATLKQWRDKSFAQRDLIHLNLHGYRLKGQMLADAIIHTMEWMQVNEDATCYTLDTWALEQDQEERLKKLYQGDAVPAPSGDYLVYKIRSGDTLGHIAQRFGVTVRQLQYWNNLNGTMIIAGKTLRIYK